MAYLDDAIYFTDLFIEIVNLEKATNIPNVTSKDDVELSRDLIQLLTNIRKNGYTLTEIMRLTKTLLKNNS